MSDTTAEDLSNVELFDVNTLQDPYDVYTLLRNKAPVFHVPEMNLHVVTRYDLVREVIKDTDTFSSEMAPYVEKHVRRALIDAAPEDVREKILDIRARRIETPPTLTNADNPAHDKYRALVSKLFTAGEIRKAEDTVKTVIDANMVNLLADSPVEFIEAFAFPVPIRIIGDRLGIPEEHRKFFEEGATAAAAELRFSPISHEEMIRRAEIGVELQKFLVTLIEECRRKPQDNMINILANTRLEDEDRYLTHGECLGILNLFLVAGHETTTSTFGWGMLMLCRYPELQDKLRDNPALIKTFIEEVLRIESPVQGNPRIVTRDTELGGNPLKAGEAVMLHFGSANRDERQFDEPEVLNLQREKAGAHLAFGSGLHHCIGAPLARQELLLGFPAILENMANIRLADGFPPPEIEPSFLLRSMPKLHIEYDRIGR